MDFDVKIRVSFQGTPDVDSVRLMMVNALRQSTLHAHGASYCITGVQLYRESCPACLDRPGKDGLGRTCKSCRGMGVKLL